MELVGSNIIGSKFIRENNKADIKESQPNYKPETTISESDYKNISSAQASYGQAFVNKIDTSTVEGFAKKTGVNKDSVAKLMNPKLIPSGKKFDVEKALNIVKAGKAEVLEDFKKANIEYTSLVRKGNGNYVLTINATRTELNPNQKNPNKLFDGTKVSETTYSKNLTKAFDADFNEISSKIYENVSNKAYIVENEDGINYFKGV